MKGHSTLAYGHCNPGAVQSHPWDSKRLVPSVFLSFHFLCSSLMDLLSYAALLMPKGLTAADKVNMSYQDIDHLRIG